MSISGTWHNQHGSLLHLVHEGIRLEGSFVVGVGLSKGESFPVQGVVNGEQLAFVVSFGREGAITAWVGHHSSRVLETLWSMTVRMEGKDAAGWRGIWSGADRFEPGEPALVLLDTRMPSAPLQGIRS